MRFLCLHKPTIPALKREASYFPFSFFRKYNDGIGFGRYSLRLSNFSLNNIPKNWTLATGFAIGLGTSAAERIVFSTLNLFNNTNYWLHHSLETSIASDVLNMYEMPIHLLKEALSNGTCNAMYRPSQRKNMQV